MTATVLINLVMILSLLLFLICSMKHDHFLGKAETIYHILLGMMIAASVFLLAVSIIGTDRFSSAVWTCVLGVYAAVWIVLLLVMFLMNRNEKQHGDTGVKRQESTKKGVSMAMIDTHFFFASLTAVVNLCDRDPKLAKEITLNFTKFIRMKMDLAARKEPVSFEEELEHTQAYLGVQQARFKNRVNTAFDLQVLKFKLPPLTLQPLVENAVKHGITMKSAGGTVRISSREEDTYFCVCIEDDGIGFDPTLLNTQKDSTIVEIKEHLRSMVGGTMEITSEADKGTMIRISIPKEQK